MVPGLVRVSVVPWKSSTVSLLAAGLADDVLVGGPEVGEVHRLGVLDRRDEQLAGAVGLGHVDREAEVDVAGDDQGRLAVLLGEAVVHLRHVAQRLDQGVADEVGEATPCRRGERCRWLLMTTRLSMSSLAGTARTLVAVGTVSDVSMLVTVRALAPRSGLTSSWLTASVCLGRLGLAGLGGLLARRSRRRCGLLVLGLVGDGLVGCGRRACRCSWPASAGVAAAAAGAAAARGRRRAGAAAGAAAGAGAGAAGAAAAAAPARRGAAGAARRRRSPLDAVAASPSAPSRRLVVLEEGPPRLVDRVLVVLVLLIQLVHEPLVRPEGRHGVVGRGLVGHGGYASFVASTMTGQIRAPSLSPPRRAALRRGRGFRGDPHHARRHAGPTTRVCRGAGSRPGNRPRGIPRHGCLRRA